MFSCPDCDRSFPTARAYYGHRGRKHSSKPIDLNAEVHRTRLKERAAKVRASYDASPKICQNCQLVLPFKQRVNTYCSPSCRATVVNRKRVPIKPATPAQYREQCLFRFNIYDHASPEEVELFETLGWYHNVENPNGASRDHLYSVARGYRDGVDPAIIRHPANCRVIPMQENSRKNSRCAITLDELKRRIETYEGRGPFY